MTRISKIVLLLAASALLLAACGGGGGGGSGASTTTPDGDSPPPVNSTSSGWSSRQDIGRHKYVFDGPEGVHSRSDSMNSRRDVLSSWTNGSTLYANTYTKTGGWAGAQAISSSALDPVSGLSENGEGVIVWAERIYVDAANGWRREMRAKHYRAGSWGDAVILSGAESGTNPGEPSVRLDKDGNAVVAWHVGHYYARTYDRATDTWSPVKQISTNSNPPVGRPHMGVTGNGEFVLAWLEYDEGNNLFVRRYSKAGGWLAAEQLTVDAPAAREENELLGLSVNGNGDVFVLWMQDPNTYPESHLSLLLRKYSAGTRTWEPTLTVDTSNSSLSPGTVKSDPAGNAVVHWQKSSFDDVTGTTTSSNNFAVYYADSSAMGPTEQMLRSAYDIRALDVVAAGTGGFRMFYSKSIWEGPAYQRIYDYAAKTWSAPTVIVDVFGQEYIATSNSAGEILLTSGLAEYVISNNYSQQWDVVGGVFFLP